MTNVPNTRNFAAWINLQPGADKQIIVTGEVETAASYLVPTLSRAVPQGINPQHLILELTIVNTGKPGTENVDYRRVRYQEAASQGQFTHVEIRYDGQVILVLDVTEAH